MFIPCNYVVSFDPSPATHFEPPSWSCTEEICSCAREMLASKADAPGRCLGQLDHGETMGKREGNYGKLLILVGNNLRAAEWCLFWNALLFCPRISSAILIFNPDTVVTVSKWSKRTLPDMHPTQFQRGICILHDVAIPELEWTFSVFFQPRKPRKGTIEMRINGIYLLLHFHQSHATADLQWCHRKATRGFFRLCRCTGLTSRRLAVSTEDVFLWNDGKENATCQKNENSSGIIHIYWSYILIIYNHVINIYIYDQPRLYMINNQDIYDQYIMLSYHI